MDNADSNVTKAAPSEKPSEDPKTKVTGFLVVVSDGLMQREDASEALLTLSWLQARVGGYIEMPRPFRFPSRHRPGVEITTVVNEEGKLVERCLPNFVVQFRRADGVVYGDDVIQGTALFIGGRVATGACIPLTPEECEDILLLRRGKDTLVRTELMGTPGAWCILRPLPVLQVKITTDTGSAE
jgi:hypothetical protein